MTSFGVITKKRCCPQLSMLCSSMATLLMLSVLQLFWVWLFMD